MSGLSLKIGFWSAVFMIISGIGYASCFLIMIMLYPDMAWNGIEAFAASYKTSWGTVLLAMQFIAFLQPLAIVVLVSCIHDYAAADKKLFTRIGLSFAVAFAIVSGINYFIQMTTVRQSVLSGQLDGMGQLVQLNPASPMFSLVILSWGVFQGIAMLAIAPVFSGSKLKNVLRWLLVVYGLDGLIGGLGCILGSSAIMMAFLIIINVIQPLIMIALCVLFYKSIIK